MGSFKFRIGARNKNGGAIITTDITVKASKLTRAERKAADAALKAFPNSTHTDQAVTGKKHGFWARREPRL